MEATIEKDAEQLRLTLPLMSRHGADFGPRSYALWFGYAAGASTALREALDPLVAAGGRLTPERTTELYERHIAQESERALEQLRAALGIILGRLGEATGHAGDATASFAAELVSVAQRLEHCDANPTAQVLSDLARHASLTTATLSRFGSQLAEEGAAVDRLRRELASVREAALTDALTNLANRRAFDERFEAAVSAFHGGSGGQPAPALILIDIDHFKRINDAAGHVFGDRVLRAVADTLKANLKGRDLVARYGGEEFAVLLERTQQADAFNLAEALRQAVSAIRIRRSGDVVAEVRISCGVGALEAGEAPIAFIDRVDAALYQAKRAGRNRVASAARRPRATP